MCQCRITDKEIGGERESEDVDVDNQRLRHSDARV